MKLLVFLMLFIVILSGLASAATIKGNVYDLSLNKVKDVVISIDSIPKQSVVAKDGSYSFSLGKGTYTLSVKSEKGNVEETIEIDEDGIFNLDLILFPADEEIEDLDLEVDIEGDSNILLISVITLLVLLIIALLYWRFKPKKKVEEKNKESNEVIEDSSDLDNLIEFIKGEGGRTTQKDIRKKFGLSEAKISLMITELEHKNKVKRIKKGRGNVVILEKE
ncbi:MAG TPA: hypothetical protein VJJ53_03400 [Candidatus Nanoarchaeia archaeon]|nr:hypothetical protein [Candidatus Nanoarchaeia archaeon]